MPATRRLLSPARWRRAALPLRFEQLEDRLAPAGLELLWPTGGNTAFTYFPHAGLNQAVDINADNGKGALADRGALVVAAHDGYVQAAGANGGYGNAVLLSSNPDGTGLRTRYAHLQSITPGVAVATPRMFVRSGTVLGFVGKTGNANELDHLHFEVLQNSTGVELDRDNDPTAPKFWKGYVAPTDRTPLTVTVGPQIISPVEQTIAAKPGEVLQLDLRAFDWNEGVEVILRDEFGGVVFAQSRATEAAPGTPTRIEVPVPTEAVRYYLSVNERNRVPQLGQVNVNHEAASLPLIIALDSTRPVVTQATSPGGPFVPGNAVAIGYGTADNTQVERVGI